MEKLLGLELLANWRTIVTRAWSVRLTSLAMVLSAIEVAIPFFAPMVKPGTFAILAALAALGGVVARLILQRDMVDVDVDEPESGIPDSA